MIRLKNAAASSDTRIMKNLLRLAIAVSIFSPAVPVLADDVQFGGYVEQFYVSGRLVGKIKTEDRFTRVNGSAEWKNWRLALSYWAYEFCGWRDLDETTIQYQSGRVSTKFGRFIPAIAQANWDDQWYSGFVYLPLAESQVYSGRRLLERTSPGAQVDIELPKGTLQVALIDADPQIRRPLPRSLDRASIRYQTTIGGVLTGVSSFGDSAVAGKTEQLRAIDFRYSKPQWITRGAVSSYQSKDQKIAAYFVDVYHRPKGWNDVTLLLRTEGASTKGVTKKEEYLITLGLKVKLPQEFLLNANYTFGAGSDRLTLGGGFAFGLIKNIRF